MNKHAPSVPQLAAMVLFTLSCIGLLMWLWLSFGGTTPLKPERYELKTSFEEASLLVEQADVRLAGVTVGKVVEKELDKARGRTIATMELEPKFAPIPADTRAILRTKALLGETYVELSPGTGSGPKLADGGTLPRSAVQRAVQIDEIVNAFDEPTRRAFQSWVRELARTIDRRGDDLNDSLGNLPSFVASGDDVLAVLDRHEPVLERLVRNGARALGAVNERRGQLRQLIGNANDTFGALASRDDALAETIRILPTFLDESRATLERLRGFARDTRPLVRDLQPVATDLAPTLDDVGRFSPDLRRMFLGLDTVIDESPDTLPAAARYLRGAEPVLVSLHRYLPELNPVLSYLNFSQQQVADFIMNGAGSLSATLPDIPGQGPRHYLRQFTTAGLRSLNMNPTRPPYERGNAYPAPNYLKRSRGLGVTESFDCKPTGEGEVREPENGIPPCYVQPRSLFDDRRFPRLRRGGAPVRRPPEENEGR